MSRTCATLFVAIVYLLMLIPPPAVSSTASGQEKPIGPAVAGHRQNRSQMTEGLSLLQVRQLALEHNPELAARHWSLQEQAGRSLQAGLLPNPELSIDVENFAGEEELSGFDGAETTLAISQLVELGGKRAQRREVAGLRQELAEWELQAGRLDLINRVDKAYVEVVAAQERLQQAAALAELARAIDLAVSERVEAGKVAPVEKIRSGVAYASARLTMEQSRRSLETARRQLAAFWGESEPGFSRATERLDADEAIPELDRLSPLLEQTPDLARWQTELAIGRGEQELAAAAAVPDLNLSLGWRHFRETGQQALVAGIQLPLPLFDRHQGERKAAVSALNRLHASREAALLRSRAELATAYEQLASAHAELLMLSRELLPGAESAFEVANFGYREGKFGFLDVIDAQRTLFEVRGQYVDALARYHLARADIERLLARPLNDLSPSSSTNHEVLP